MDWIGLIISALATSESWIPKLMLGVTTAVVSFFFLGSKVKKQFKKLEEFGSAVTSKLDGIEKALNSFGAQVMALEEKHDARLTKVEADVSDIKKDLSNLKIKLNP